MFIMKLLKASSITVVSNNPEDVSRFLRSQFKCLRDRKVLARNLIFLFFCGQFLMKLGETGDFISVFWLKNETGCGFMGEIG